LLLKVFMLKKNVVLAALGFAVSLFSVSAAAQNYAGAAVGKTTWNGFCSNGDYCSSDVRLVFGADFTFNWGGELSYYNLSSVSNPSYYGGNTTVKSSGIDAVAIYRIPFGNSKFSGFAKFGFALNNGDMRMNSVNYSHTSREPVFGAGVNYQFTPDMMARIGIDERRVQTGAANFTKFRTSNLHVGLFKYF
jgi:hypothetical protein